MAKSPKFMVFHLRELIYTLVFILLGIILIISLVIMFYNRGNKQEREKIPEYTNLEFTHHVSHLTAIPWM